MKAKALKLALGGQEFLLKNGENRTRVKFPIDRSLGKKVAVGQQLVLEEKLKEKLP